MTGPNLHRHVAVYKGHIAGGAASHALLAAAVLSVALAAVAGFGLPGWLFVLAFAAVALLLSGLRRRVVVRMDLYTVRIRNVLLPGAGRRVPVRSIRAIRIIESSPRAAEFLRWLPGARRSVLLRHGPAVELELTTGATEVLGLEEPYEASRMLRRFHAETTGRELPEDVLADDEAYFLWRRNRAAARPGRPGARAAVPKPRAGKAGAAKANAAKADTAKANAARTNAAKAGAAKAANAKAAAKQAAARQNAAKSDAAGRAAAKANAARQQAQQRRR